MKSRALVRLGAVVGNGQFPVANERVTLAAVGLVGGNSIAVQKSTDLVAPFVTFIPYEQVPGVPLLLTNVITSAVITEPGQYRLVVNAAAAPSYVLYASSKVPIPVYYGGLPSGGHTGDMLARIPGAEFLAQWIDAASDFEVDAAIVAALATAVTPMVLTNGPDIAIDFAGAPVNSGQSVAGGFQRAGVQYLNGVLTAIGALATGLATIAVPVSFVLPDASTVDLASFVLTVKDVTTGLYIPAHIVGNAALFTAVNVHDYDLSFQLTYVPAP